MVTNQQTTKAYFKTLTIIHLSLVLGIVLFGLVVLFFIADFQHPDYYSELARLFVYLVPGLVLIGIVASNVVSKIRLTALKQSSDLTAKLKGYNEPLIIRYVFIESPALFALVAIFITNDINYLVYAGLLVVLLIFKRPTIRSVIADLELDQQEIAVIEDPDSII
jgi:hypothetical protein